MHRRVPSWQQATSNGARASKCGVSLGSRVRARLEQPLVLLVDEGLLGEVDEVHRRLGGDELQRVQQVRLLQVPLAKPGAETLSRSVSLRFHSPNLAQKPSAGQSPSGSTRQTWRRNPQQVSLPQVPLAKPGAATRRWDRHGAAGSVGQPPLWPGSRTRACRHALLHATMQAQATRKPARGRTPRPPPHAALVMHGREVRLRNLLARSPCPSGQGRAARPRGGARRAAART